MNKPDRVLSMLGIAAKGRNVVSGEFATEKAVKTGKAYLVIVAEEASDNTKKMFTNMCEFYEVPIAFYGDKDALGHAIGRQMRASLAVTDAGLANGILKLLEGNK
ncbi:MAG: ribosomal L7Ae/L30e/S12e/Gadd45 family protein [Lachnospiraceae bacterium]|jgi:ribosomal protein L7Ae-like RNA K-turn-binding protein|nr:ribosomal L7Ae/L30e/S12e/Gadd45 family protein [Lachnospiraceae bacterium]